MDEERIEVQADTLQEARAQLRAQVPEGFTVLSEEVLADGEPKTARLSAVPDNVQVLAQKELSTPATRTAVVKAFAEAGAQAAAQALARRELGEFGHYRNLRLVSKGGTGFLGLVKKPDEYEVELYREAVFEVTYRTRARISARIRDEQAYLTLQIAQAGNRQVDEDKRMTIIKELAASSDARVPNVLISLLNEPEGGVQNHAVIALGQMRNAAAVEPLIQVLLHGEDHTGTGGVRYLAAVALGRIGDARAMSALKAALEDQNWNVRDGAAMALQWLDPRSDWGRMCAAIRALRPATKARLEQLGAKYRGSQKLGSVGEVIHVLQDEREKYTRVVGWNAVPDAVGVSFDNYVRIGADEAPATRRLDIDVVRAEGQFVVYMGLTFL